jgi:hypothetical protein
MLRAGLVDDFVTLRGGADEETKSNEEGFGRGHP